MQYNGNRGSPYERRVMGRDGMGNFIGTRI